MHLFISLSTDRSYRRGSINHHQRQARGGRLLQTLHGCRYQYHDQEAREEEARGVLLYAAFYPQSVALSGVQLLFCGVRDILCEPVQSCRVAQEPL